MRHNEITMAELSLDAVIKRLVAHAADLKGRGILHAAVFGSVARGEAGEKSDVDVLVELDSEAGLTLLDYVAVQLYLEQVLGRPVDMANRKTLKPLLRDQILAEAVDAF